MLITKVASPVSSCTITVSPSDGLVIVKLGTGVGGGVGGVSFSVTFISSSPSKKHPESTTESSTKLNNTYFMDKIAVVHYINITSSNRINDRGSVI